MMLYKVRDLVTEYKLNIVSGSKGLDNEIKIAQVSRPGLELAGLFDFFEHDRVLVMGSKEVHFYGWLNESDKDIRVRILFEKKPPMIIFSKNAEIPDSFVKYSEEFGIPVCKSNKKTSGLISSLYLLLNAKLASRISLHGTLLDVNGIGVLVRGQSGVGKSEIALELVRRGHQLVADDRVDIYEREKGVLVGEAPEILKKYLEIRGIGIVNVVDLFGVKAYKENKKIMLIIDLEYWDQNKDYDRLGLDNETITYFDTEVSYVKIPVSPGRNTASLVEVAAMNARLKYLGKYSAQEFSDSVTRKIQENTEE
jgi:HPr kinase/phosphorylase